MIHHNRLALPHPTTCTLVIMTKVVWFHFSGNKRSVSILCGKDWNFPWIHRLVHCSFREPGDRGRNSGAQHRTQL